MCLSVSTIGKTFTVCSSQNEIHYLKRGASFLTAKIQSDTDQSKNKPKLITQIHTTIKPIRN